MRPFAEDDLDALHAMHSRPDVARFLYWGPRTREEVHAALEKKVKSSIIASEGDVLALAAVLRETGEVIGDFDLQWLSEEHGQGEIGFIVHPDHQGRGYATEACRVLLRLAFEDLKLHRVVGRLEARNTASARVLEKLGMRREAHLAVVAALEASTYHSSRRRRLIVDGMNVIGSRPDRWWNDPDRAVRRLIDELDRYASQTNEEITVVFDRRPPDLAPGHHGAVTVAFASRRGRNAADHDIAEMVAKDPVPGSLTVVTSDAALAEQVRALGARVRSSGAFRRQVEKTVGGASQ